MSSESDNSQDTNYKQKYRALKKHLLSLIYENECFQDELRKAQRNFIRIRSDKSFLFDRILLYEKPVGYVNDSATSESSGEECQVPQSTSAKKKVINRKQSKADLHNEGPNRPIDSYYCLPGSSKSKGVKMKSAVVKKTKRKKVLTAQRPIVKKERLTEEPTFNFPLLDKRFSEMNERTTIEDEETDMGHTSDNSEHKFEFSSDGQMTREDIERHLESRRYSSELELNTTTTVPAELFSQDPEPGSDFENSEMCYDPSADMILE